MILDFEVSHMISWSVTVKKNEEKKQKTPQQPYKVQYTADEKSISVLHSYQSIVIKHDLKFWVTELKEILKFYQVHLCT